MLYRINIVNIVNGHSENGQCQHRQHRHRAGLQKQLLKRILEQMYFDTCFSPHRRPLGDLGGLLRGLGLVLGGSGVLLEGLGEVLGGLGLPFSPSGLVTTPPLSPSTLPSRTSKSSETSQGVAPERFCSGLSGAC